MEFIQNDLSKAFIKAAENLKKTGIVKGYKELADSIGLNQTTMSNVMKGRRDLPNNFAKTFQDTYKVVLVAGAQDALIADFEQRLLRAEAHLEVYESTLASLLAKEKADIMEKVSAKDFTEKVKVLRLKVSEAVDRRYKKLGT